MPNHIHMLIAIDIPDIGHSGYAPTISRVIKQFKGAVSKKIGFSPWQKSFHDKIINSEAEYCEAINYIDSNPMNWINDDFHP